MSGVLDRPHRLDDAPVNRRYLLVGVGGFEPPTLGPKPKALPLSYTPTRRQRIPAGPSRSVPKRGAASGGRSTARDRPRRATPHPTSRPSSRSRPRCSGAWAAADEAAGRRRLRRRTLRRLLALVGPAAEAAARRSDDRLDRHEEALLDEERPRRPVILRAESAPRHRGVHVRRRAIEPEQPQVVVERLHAHRERDGLEADPMRAVEDRRVDRVERRDDLAPVEAHLLQLESEQVEVGLDPPRQRVGRRLRRA